MRARISATWPRMPTRDVFLLNLFQCPGRTLLIATTPSWAPGRRTRRARHFACQSRIPASFAMGFIPAITLRIYPTSPSHSPSYRPLAPIPPPPAQASTPAEPPHAINAVPRLSSRSSQLLIRRAFIERGNGVGINQVSPVAVNLSKGRQFSFAGELLIARARPLTKRNSQARLNGIVSLASRCKRERERERHTAASREMM